MFDVVSVPALLAGRPDLDGDYGFVARQDPCEGLLAEAGFPGIGVADTTAGDIRVARRWLDAVGHLEADLRLVLGDDVLEGKVANRRSSYEMMLTGELGRTLYRATG